MAAGLGGKKMVSLLLSAGADGQFDRQAFIRAAAAGHPGIVRRLLSDGASPEPKALIRAAGEGHAEVVRILLEAGADPESNKARPHGTRFRQGRRTYSSSGNPDGAGYEFRRILAKKQQHSECKETCYTK